MPAASEFSFEALEPLVPVASTPRSGGAAPPSLTAAEELEHARAEAEELRRQAREQGFQDGYAAGHARALAEAGSAATALIEARTALHAEAAASAAALETDAVELALGLTEKIVAGAVSVRPELVVDVVHNALRGIVERERVTVLVHPDDLAVVSGAMAGVQAEMGGIDHWEVQAERRVARGGAIVRHVHGDVDARLQAKLERAREVVEGELGEAG